MNEYKYADIKLGTKEFFQKTITIDMENKFREITGDLNPLHYDDIYAKEVSDGKYNNHVCFGMLTASLYSTLAGMYLPGKYSLIHSLEDLSFKAPVFCGDELTISGEVIDKIDLLKLIIIKLTIKNQNHKTVSNAKMKVIVLK